MEMQLSIASKTFSYILDYLGIDSVWDGIRIILDVGIVTYLFYRLFNFLKDSRAMQLIKGVIIIFVVAILASLLRLTTISYALNIVLEILPLLIALIFLPELRRALEGLGNKPLASLFNRASEKNKALSSAIDETVNAAFVMGEERVGALIVFERETNLTEIANTGTAMDAKVSAQLLRLLFIPNTPLHDGAVIIRGDRVLAAASILPLSENRSISKDLGTRHRAGIGISERTDCVSVIVSEETGAVSVAQDGNITLNVSKNTLRSVLRDSLMKKEKVHQQSEKALRESNAPRSSKNSNKKKGEKK